MEQVSGESLASAVVTLLGLALAVSALWSNRKRATNDEFDRQRRLLEDAEARARRADRDARRWRRAYELLLVYATKLLRWALAQPADLPADLQEIPPDVDDED